MIVNSPIGVSPDIEISIGFVEVNYTSIISASLRLNEGQHDMLSLKMLGLPTRGLTDYIGAPVRFVLRKGTSFKQEFLGEVAIIEPSIVSKEGVVNDSPIQVADIHCFGVSYRMRGTKSKVWGDVTLERIASEIASRYRLSLDVPASQYIHKKTTQINTSDWQFLNEVCDSVGLRVSVHGTHMHIWDSFRATGRQSSYHFLNSIKETAGNPVPTPGAIIKFIGSASSAEATTRTTTVLDGQGNVTRVVGDIQVDRSGLGKPFVSSFTSQFGTEVMSVEEAELEIKSSIRKVNPFTAKVTTAGVLGSVPGGLVDLRGYNSKVDGLWYVRGLTHYVSISGMLTEFDITKNSTNDQPFEIFNTQRFTEPSDSIVLDGFWASKTRQVRVYA